MLLTQICAILVIARIWTRGVLGIEEEKDWATQVAILAEESSTECHLSTQMLIDT